YPTIRALTHYLSQKPSKKSFLEQNHQRANQQKQAINRHKQRRLQKGRIQNSEFRIQNPESRIQNSLKPQLNNLNQINKL
ncbi:hypothetical protein, partial [Nostoc sp. CCY 9925]|uniref:hypothetical protein n=1 Tax=Nostoc sp. CCY 9925 TaxID=3103865 RepID=UPI0039C60EBF